MFLLELATHPSSILTSVLVFSPVFGRRSAGVSYFLLVHFKTPREPALLGLSFTLDFHYSGVSFI